jgi:anaerobic ribonucleoside-triphosphate reductase
MQKILDGGAILPIAVKPKTSAEGLAVASREISKQGVHYFNFSIFLSRCQKCYNVTQGVHNRCGKCNSENLTLLTKNGGRLIPTDTLPEARRRDLERIVSYEFS